MQYRMFLVPGGQALTLKLCSKYYHKWTLHRLYDVNFNSVTSQYLVWKIQELVYAWNSYKFFTTDFYENLMVTFLSVIHSSMCYYLFDITNCLFPMLQQVNPASHQLSCLASATLAKCAFLCTVLAENLEHFHLAFCVGMFGLEMARPPASTKPLEVSINS
jgi:hypothetical protein